MYMKKRRGESNYIAFGVVLLAVIILIIANLDWSGAQVKGDRIVEVMRKYVLIMEGNGCLTLSQQQSLTEELERLGVTNITYHCNPLEKASYGEEVVLSISGEVNALKITSFDDLNVVRTQEGVRFSKTLKSTAQY